MEVHGNRDMNKQQRDALRPPPPNPPPPSDPPPPITSSPPTHATPPPPPPTAPTRHRYSLPPTSTPPLPSPTSIDRVETRTLDQVEIMREIGFHCHTQARKTFWQTRAGPNVCHYHMANHASTSCNTLNRAIALALAASPPPQPFVPNTAAYAPVARHPSSVPPSVPPPINLPQARARHTTD